MVEGGTEGPAAIPEVGVEVEGMVEVEAMAEVEVEGTVAEVVGTGVVVVIMVGEEEEDTIVAAEVAQDLKDTSLR